MRWRLNNLKYQRIWILHYLDVRVLPNLGGPYGMDLLWLNWVYAKSYKNWKEKHCKREKAHSSMGDQLSGSVMLQSIELTFKRNLQYFQHGKELIGLCWFCVVLKGVFFCVGNDLSWSSSCTYKERNNALTFSPHGQSIVI